MRTCWENKWNVTWLDKLLGEGIRALHLKRHQSESWECEHHSAEYCSEFWRVLANCYYSQHCSVTTSSSAQRMSCWHSLRNSLENDKIQCNWTSTAKKEWFGYFSRIITHCDFTNTKWNCILLASKKNKKFYLKTIYSARYLWKSF